MAGDSDILNVDGLPLLDSFIKESSRLSVSDASKSGECGLICSVAYFMKSPFDEKRLNLWRCLMARKLGRETGCVSRPRQSPMIQPTTRIPSISMVLDLLPGMDLGKTRSLLCLQIPALGL